MDRADRGGFRLWQDLVAGCAAFLVAFEDGQPPEVHVNEALWAAVGYQAAGLGKEGDTLDAGALHPDDRLIFDRYLERLRTDPGLGAASVRYRLGHADGSPRWFVSSPVRVETDPAGRVRAVLNVAIPTDLPGAEALRVAAERFEAAIAASPVVVFSQDRDLRYTWIQNPALDYAPDHVVGKTDRDLFQRAEDAARTEAIKREVLASGIGQRHEVKVWHAGMERCYDLSVRPQFGPDGAIVGVICAAVDFTDRTRIESDLAFLSELTGALAPTATVAEGTRVAAALVARHFGLSRCVLAEVDEPAQALEVLYDHGTEAGVGLLGRHALAEFVAEDRRDELARGQAIEIGTARVDAPYVANGRWTFLLTAIHAGSHPWRPSHVQLLQEIAARIFLRLERLRAEMALRAAHDTFHHLVEHSPFGVYAVDADFRLVQVSAGAQPVFRGIQPLLGRDFAEVIRQIWPEPFATDVIGIFRHTLATGEAYHAPPSVERRRDSGAVESYDWKTERLVLPDGRAGVVCHFYDLTDRQRLVDALREAARHKDEFVAMLAHELRNPLAPIRTAVSVLRMRDRADAILSSCADTIERQTAQMSRLLDDLLDMSRLTTGRLDLQPAPVAIADVLDAAVETSRPGIDRQGQRLRVSMADERLTVVGDAARLIQVFANLLNNASKFSAKGSPIDVEAGRQGGHAVIRVRDRGIGIAPEMLERVFTLYTQGSAPGHRPSSGLGIGLSLARRLVELHGGTLHAASAGLDHGSEFTVTMPLAEAVDRAGGRVLPAVPPPAIPGVRVLVVDDNVDSADMLALHLQQHGCEVLTAYDGTTALHAADAHRPAVVLLDLGLPDLDGCEVCRRIRLTDWGRQAVLIAISGWGRDEDLRRSREAGCDHHLTKPVDPAALVRLVRTVQL